MNLNSIITIAKKELNGFFNSPMAYVVMIVFLFLWEFLFFRVVFLEGVASLRVMFDFLPWLFLLVIPALTMGMVSQERSEGTVELLLTHPIRSREMILGKFLAGFLFVAITLLPMFFIAWTLSEFGMIDWGVVISQYLAAVFLASVLVSVGIFISTIFPRQVSAFLVSVFVMFFLLISGFNTVTDRLPSGIARVMEQISVFGHYQSMIRGVIDVRDVWYFFSVTVVFLLLAIVWFVRMKYGNRKTFYRNFITAVVAIVAIVFLTNQIGTKIPGRLDMTVNKSYTLSQTTKDIVNRLEDEVRVTFYSSGELPSQLQAVSRDVRDVLRDYELIGGSKLKVEYKNPDIDDGARARAEELGIQPVQFNLIGNEEFQVKNGFLAIAVEYKEASETIPFIDQAGTLEFQLSGFILSLTNPEKKKLVFLSGHGERDRRNGIGFFMEALERQFLVQSVSPSDDGNALDDDPEIQMFSSEDEEGEEETNPEDVYLELPDDTDVLVVVGPTEEMNERTQQEIKDYLNNGGAAFFALDGNRVFPQTLSGSVNEFSGGAVLEEFGITIEPDMAYDLQSHQSVNFGGRVGYVVPYPYWIISTVPATDALGAFMRGGIVFPWASTISVDEGKISERGLTLSRFLTTTDSGNSVIEPFDISAEFTYPQSGLERKNIAVRVSGEKETDPRIIVVADTDFISDDFLSGQPTNLAFGLYGVEWLAQEKSLAEIGLKNAQENQLLFTDESQPLGVKSLNYIVIIAAPLLYGVWRLFRRRQLRKRKYRA